MLKIILLLTSFISLNATTKNYLVKNIMIPKNNILIIDACNDFKKSYLNGPFKAIYDPEINLHLLDESLQIIPFIMSIISIIWQSGETYYVKSMDRNLYESLKKIKKIYEIFYPQVTWNGSLEADVLIDHAEEKKSDDTLGLVFSGGVDSTYTSLIHTDKKQILITYLGFSEEISQKNWVTVRRQCADFAERYGNKKNYFVTSNFRFFIKFNGLHKKYPTMNSWREFCQESLSLSGLAAPILILNNCLEFLISSSWDWDFRYPWGSHPYIDELIKYEKISVHNCDYNVNRQEKLKTIANICAEKNLQKPIYHVCRGQWQGKTCSQCEKCLRTLNGLIVEKENPQDYGFEISKEKLFSTTKMQFDENKITQFTRFTIAVAHIWKDIQIRAQERLSNKDFDNDPETKAYLEWLCTVNFKNHINLNQFTQKIDIKKIHTDKTP